MKEQLLTTLPEDVRMWVKERKPKTTTDAAQLAEDYLQARPAGTPPKPDHAPTGPCPRCGELGHWARLCPTNPRPPPTRQQQSTDMPRNPRTHVNSRPSDQNSRPQDVKCYNCSAKGHLSHNCPQKALFSSTTPAIVTNKRQERAYQRGTINGVYCKDIVVDTGASKTLVRSDLVTQDDILEGVVNIQCAHGDIVSYPLAAVKIAVEGKEIIAHAAVAQSLPVAALLGWDVPDLMALSTPELTPRTGGALPGRSRQSPVDRKSPRTFLLSQQTSLLRTVKTLTQSMIPLRTPNLSHLKETIRLLQSLISRNPSSPLQVLTDRCSPAHRSVLPEADITPRSKT